MMMFGALSRTRVVGKAAAARLEDDWAGAAAYYRGYLNHHPNDFPLWVQLGHCLKEAGQYADALEAYQNARALRHLDSDLLLNIGHLFKLKRQPSFSYGYYKLSYEIDGNADALVELLYSASELRVQTSPPTSGGPPMRISSINEQTIPAIKAATEQSGLFDPEWYRRTYLDGAADTDPIVHFIREGIANQLDPSEHFSTRGYLIANPDVVQTEASAFLHYLWSGRSEGRPFVLVAHDAYDRVREALPDMFALRQRERRARLAIVAHIFYPEIWPEIRDLLAHMTEPFDLYVSLIEGASEDAGEVILADHPDAHILTFPNHGRDCFPFTEFLNSGALEGYDLVCKLHTKRSLHRDDGDTWRNDLYSGLLGSAETIGTIVAEMRESPDAGIFVPDGYRFSTEYLGSNTARLQLLLDRVNLRFDLSEMQFPSGNMFWMNQACLQYIKALKLDYLDYDVEAKQLDGTMAHAIERFAGIACYASGQRIVSMSDIASRTASPYTGDRHKLIAFYLPQFHPIAENDRWWGKGFTEWHNLQKSSPAYRGHNQPRFPSELGYYDLRLDVVREQQADLARAHGIHGFCYYHYWFDGKTLLDMPLKRLIESDLDFPFSICWANENWTRSWDGLNRDVLMRQTYAPDILGRYAHDVAVYLRDHRYIRHQGKPLFLIYKIMDIPDIAGCIRGWRQTWRDLGVGDVHVAAVRTWAKDPVGHPSDLGLDAFVDFPPQSLASFARGAPVELSKEFTGLIYDYQIATASDIARYETEESTFVHRGVMGCWDNTARRGANAHIAHGASPITYRNWLRRMMVQDAAAHPGVDRLIFVNAWNEWAEGTYLEPDQRYGRAFLEATRSVRPIA